MAKKKAKKVRMPVVAGVRVMRTDSVDSNTLTSLRKARPRSPKPTLKQRKPLTSKHKARIVKAHTNKDANAIEGKEIALSFKTPYIKGNYVTLRTEAHALTDHHGTALFRGDGPGTRVELVFRTKPGKLYTVDVHVSTVGRNVTTFRATDIDGGKGLWQTAGGFTRLMFGHVGAPGRTTARYHIYVDSGHWKFFSAEVSPMA